MNNEKLAIGDKVKCWKYGVLYDGVIHSVRKTIFGNIKYTVGVLIIDRYRLGLHHGVMTSKVRYFDFSENELMIQPKA